MSWSSRKSVVTAIAAAGVLAAGAAAYGWWGARGAAPNYRFAKVERGNVTAVVSATGTLNPVVSVQVGSQVSGQIKEIYVDYNSEVKKGQVIARIDPDTFALRVSQAMADVEAARATVLTQRANVAALQAEVSRGKVNLADAEREFRRSKALHEKNFVSEAVRDKAQAAFEAAVEQVKTAQAQLEVGLAQVRNVEALVKQRVAQLAQAQVDLERTAIRAPVDGVVISRNVDAGQTVAASLQAPTLFVIAQNLRDMQVDTSIDEAEVGRVQVGQEAAFTVDSFPARAFSGKVVQLRKAAQVVQNVVTYVAVISAPNPDLMLVPGMTANVRLVVDGRENVLRVPNAALRFRPAGMADAPKDAPKNAPGSAETAPTGGGAAGRGQEVRERLTRELGLDAEQQTKLEAIQRETGKRIRALTVEDEAERQRQVRRLRAEARDKISTMLREEQRARYQEYLAEQQARGVTQGRVFVLDAAGQPRAVNLRLGLTDGSVSQIVSGELAEGAQVIVGSGDAARTRAAAPGGYRFGFF